MKNPIRLLRPGKKSKSASKTDLKMDELQKLAIIFESFNKFQQARLIYCDFRSEVKTVTIANIVAQQFLYDNYPVVWNDFLYKLHLWAIHQYSVDQYTTLYHKRMTDADAHQYARDGRLSYEERQKLRMEEAAKFDREMEAQSDTLPDLQFLVLGLSDKPTLASKLINGQYLTVTIPDELLDQ